MSLCVVEGCGADSELQVWINDEAGNRIVDEPRCTEHFYQILYQYPDKDVPWPLYGPASLVPFRYIKAGEALRMLGREFG